MATITPIDGWWADVSGLAATAWKRVPPSSASMDWEGIGASVRLDFPWWDFEAMLAESAPHLDSSALAGLQAAVDRSAGWRQ